MEFACEQVARAFLGPPLHQRRAELCWRCPRHEDHDPSLFINTDKNCWLCGPCGMSGNAWALAAFLAGVRADDKAAVIGKLPDTVADRSIPIRLKRARRGGVEHFRTREAESEASAIAGKLAAWCQVNLETLRNVRPEIPPQLSDRQADVCEPLLAIADAAGGDWPDVARKALVELCGQVQTDEGSIGVKLLSDIKRIFYPHDDDGEPLPWA